MAQMLIVMMPLSKRFIASMLDKIAILIIFILAMLFVQYTPFTASGYMGRYVELMSIPPSHYKSIDFASDNQSSKSINTSVYYQEREADDWAKNGKQTCMNLDLTMTIWFVLINSFYYLVNELLFGSSFFKSLFGGTLKDNKSNNISALKVVLRNSFLSLLLITFVGLRFILDINYFTTIILFFILYDSTLFKTKRNLLDIITKSYLISNSSCQSDKQTKKTVYLKSQILQDNQIADSGSNNLNENRECKKSKDNRMTRKSGVILLVLLLTLSLYSIHNILSYFFADYYNLSNYNMAENLYNYKESDNSYRKVYEKEGRTWREQPKEQFAISRHVAKSTSESYWVKSEYGPIPVGKLISTYEGEGTHSYIAGYKDVRYFYWENVPPKSMEEVNEFMRTHELKKRKVYYTLPEPYYEEYCYRNSVSTFSIGGLSFVFPNSKWLQTKYLNGFANELNARGIIWSYKEIGNCMAIAYNVKSFNIRRVVACANGNAYLLETQASENLLEQSDLLCSSISFNHFDIMGGGRKITTMFCILIFCVTIGLLFFLVAKRKIEIYNRYAYTIFVVGIVSITVSFFIAICQSYLLYTSLSASCSSVYLLAGSLLTIVFTSSPLCVFYYKKSKEPWNPDYIMPSYIKRIQYDTIEKKFHKKIYYLFICIPLMVLSLLPFGFYIVLFYCVPMILISSAIFWFKKWQLWVKGSKMSEGSLNN